MKPRSAKKRFLQMIQGTGHELSALLPAEGIRLMLEFYAKERADGCAIDEDGDMLLYQWGTYDWGKGEFFEFNITRQFMDAAGEDEDIRQLSLTFKFKPSEALRKLTDGNRWCAAPDEVDEFRTFIEASDAFTVVANQKSTDVSLDLRVAG
jgi:hypothetical protein